MTDVFDDIERKGGFVRSPKAVAEMHNLSGIYGLTFVRNQGGGEFTCGRFRCQISMCDDVADLAKLRAALISKEI